jgi:DNA polymerase-3 subunit alpha
VTAEFVHLRVHTTYSLSEGAIRIAGLPGLCRQRGMPAVAMTDTNNLFGALEFSTALSAGGIQPILGCQVDVTTEAAETRARRAGPAGRRGCGTVLLLVQDERGYRNLLALIDRLYAGVGEAGGLRLPLDALTGHADGLILLSGGPEGVLGRALLEGRAADAHALAGRLQASFGGRFYIELMRHGLEAEDRIEPELIELAETLELPLVASNDVYFTDPDMYEAHDALLCIAQGVTVDQAERRRLTPEHCFKSAEEMRDLFSDLPDAVANTVLIARRCAFALRTDAPMLPAFDCGPAVSEEETLRGEAARGLGERLRTVVFAHSIVGTDVEATARAYRERLEHELDVICRMGFAGYFLIVSDFIRWAKDQGIPVGPGRGSGAGSLVAYALSITDLDPIRFGLIFERFLNPERVSMPDFDIDFCQDRRDEVIGYVQRKYGHDRVAQIITFGKLQARAALRDVGRVLGMPYGYVDKICKLVPFNPAHPPSLDDALAAEPQLRALAESDETVQKLLDIARRLEGFYRHASTHAAGVVIGGRPLKEMIPLYRDPRSDMLVTGFSMKWVEAAGLVKFDFLGLKTLTVLARAVEMVRAQGVELDLSTLPLDDARTFEMLGRGETVGVFQLESSGMREALRRLRPDGLEDVIAVVALYRPGPMDNIPSYTRRKHGREEADYLHPSLEPILRETHGIMIYQEQVMEIARALSGYSLGGADLLRRAMGKKIQSEMDRQRETFVEGAVARGASAAKAAQIFDLVAKFAGYGFNKSHAAAYAVIAYQTAYLKANHPLEFFAASMTLDLGSSDKLNVYRQELQRCGIALLPPDVNASVAGFGVERGDGGERGGHGIRYGLAAVKNVGAATIEAIVAERRAHGPYRSMADFVARVHDRHLNKRQLENLIRAGAFDRLDPNRRRLHDGADVLMRLASAAAEARVSGQIGLFGREPGREDGAADLPLPDVDDWSPIERLRQELDAVGFYLSAHPLDAYGARLKRLKAVPFAALAAGGCTGNATLAGTVVAKTERTSGKGNRYAHVQLSDPSGVFEVRVFAEVLAAARERLEVGRSVLMRATVSLEGELARGIAHAVDSLDDVLADMASDLEIAIDTGEVLPEIREILAVQPAGRGRVTLVSWLDTGAEVDVVLPRRWRIDPAVALKLKSLAGVREVQEV